MKINPINNNQTNFGAKMQVSGALNKARWSNIAKEFEAKTLTFFKICYIFT